MAITNKARAAQQKTHAYFFFAVPGDRISDVIKALPPGVRVSQFTGSFGNYDGWGQYHCDRQTLLTAITTNGGYGFYTQASFMRDD